MPGTGRTGSDPSPAPPMFPENNVRHRITSRTLWIFLAVLSLAAALPDTDQGTAARTPEPEGAQERLASDVKVLQSAGVATDGPGLVEFFRKQASSDEQRRTIGKLIVQLGDDRFAVRERASQELKALGPAAVPALQQARNHADPEVVARANRCLNALKNIPAGELLAAAVRVLAARQPQRGVETLLAYLPENPHPEVEEEIVHALSNLAVANGEVDAALVRALTDPRPVCRAIGAEVLGSLGNASHRAAARKLLTDPDRAVRLHVAMSLVYARDKEAVPALVDLVGDAPTEQASEAEDLLCQLAGPKAPQNKPGSGAAERAESRAAWKTWWQKHGATVNLAQLQAGPPRKVKVSARASATENNDVTPDKAFDRDEPPGWNSGGPAPQWIEADLAAPTGLARLRLTVNQSPDGDTTHEVWVSNSPIGEDRTKAKLVHTFNGHTHQLQQLKLDFPRGLAARYVQIRTTQSPSWVAWVSVELRVGQTRPSFVTTSAK